MRYINEIIIHCTDTFAGRDYPVREIDRWHRNRGFKMIGYHYIIHLDGSVEPGRPLEMVGAHCAGHNRNSIGICYVGGCGLNGKPEDTRTEAQKTALRELVSDLLVAHPKAEVHGHNEYSAKHCPCFNVRKEFGYE